MSALQTIAWRQGETRWLNMTLRDANGAPTASACDAVELQIRRPQAAGGDVTIPGTAGMFSDRLGPAPGWSVRLDPVTMADVPMGEAKALIWGRINGEWKCLHDRMTIMVKWGR